MTRYAKFTDHEVKTFRWPYWLLPLLLLSLVLVLGLFIFITIHSSDRFGCFFHCEQHTGQKIDNGGVYPPDFVLVRDDNDTEIPTKYTRQDDKETKASTQLKIDQIRVYGNLIFPKDKVPNSINASTSQLKVTLQDGGLEDAPSTDIASTIVDLSLYKKGTVLSYEIKCKRPSNYFGLQLDAVLNMNWKASGDDWLRKGDYFVDTRTPLQLNQASTAYKVDIQLTKY